MGVVYGRPVVYGPSYYNPYLYGGWYYPYYTPIIWSKIDEQAYKNADQVTQTIISMKYMPFDDLQKYAVALKGIQIPSKLSDALSDELNQKSTIRHHANWLQWHKREEGV